APTLVVSDENAAKQVSHVENLRMLKRKKHELGDILLVDQKHAVSMTYYRNNILHLTALPALVACCFPQGAMHDRPAVRNMIACIYPFFRREFFLQWRVENIDKEVDSLLDWLSGQKLLDFDEQSGNFLHAAENAGSPQLQLLANVISPTLELYYLMIVMLRDSREKKISRDDIEKKSFLVAQRVAMIHELNSPDFSDKHLIANFLTQLEKNRCIRLRDDDGIECSGDFSLVEKNLSLLLSPQARSAILQTAKTQS
ncbi:MAG: hypothetical protein KDJ38_20200, partial [Gammaproteobacteria bacterium]|nr:hypothetical protein [Gammaproteobacteria bacterium]